MAIEKPMVPFKDDDDVIDEDITVELKNPDMVSAANPDSVSIETEDGGMIIDFTGEQVDQIMGDGFDRNLAEEIEEADLQSMASELLSNFNSDRQSRSEWAKSYVKGLDLLGMKIHLVCFTLYLQNQ